MTDHMSTSPTSVNTVNTAINDLSWLLEDFVNRVTGADSALLASRDGIRLAMAGLTVDQADAAAAGMSGLYSMARGAATVTRAADVGGLRQLVVEHDATTLFVMSAGDGLPKGAAVPVGSDPGKVGSVLGVWAHPDADARVIGYEMLALINSVAEYLVTPRRSAAPPDDAPCGDASSGDGSFGSGQ